MTDIGQLNCVTFLSLRKGWKAEEDKLLDVGGKWDVNVSLMERTKQHQQISRNLLLSNVET